MRLEEYRTQLMSLPWGKRLPTAVYVFWDKTADFGKDLNLLIATLAARHQIGPEFNLIKFRTDELKISFLSYPDFMEIAHPSLRCAVTVDLATAKARSTDYTQNHNPPILHRKETFLPPNHPRRREFEALTSAEEAAGLYEQTATIGFKLNWQQLLTAKGLQILGHELGSVEGATQNADPNQPAEKQVLVVERHKTAMTRYDLSKPVKTLLEYGMLKTGATSCEP